MYCCLAAPSFCVRSQRSKNAAALINGSPLSVEITFVLCLVAISGMQRFLAFYKTGLEALRQCDRMPCNTKGCFLISCKIEDGSSSGLEKMLLGNF